MPRGRGKQVQVLQLSCNLCKQELSTSRTIPGVVALYMAHMVTDHWELIEDMRNKPDGVTVALMDLETKGII